jgi:hypothetical protein
MAAARRAVTTVGLSSLPTPLARHKALVPRGAPLRGKGAVYKAEDTKLRREIALKTLTDQFAEDPERVGRLQREARTLATLQQSNIASNYDLEEANDRCFVVMEFVQGEYLSSRLRQGSPTELETWARRTLVPTRRRAATQPDSGLASGPGECSSCHPTCVVNQMSGEPTTPAFCMTSFRRALPANPFAASILLKS